MRKMVWPVVSLPYLVTVLALPPAAYNNSSDTFLYLDIARNIAEGRGAIVSFNVYRSWTGLFAPAWPFIHMGLPLILAMALKFIHSLRWLIALQFIPAWISLILVHRIALRIYQDRGVALWAALLVGVSVSMENVVMRSMTEPWHLVPLLGAVLLCHKEGKGRAQRMVLVGILLFAAIFIRAASLVYPFAFAFAFLVRRGAWRERLIDAATVLVVPLGLWTIYQSVIYAKFGVLAPQYPEAFSRFYQMSSGGGKGAFGANAAEAFRALYCLLRILLVFFVLRVVKALRARSSGELLLLSLAVVQLGTHLVFYRGVRIGEFGWARFVLVPIIAGFIMGLKGARDVGDRYLPRLKGVFFAGLAVSVLVANAYQSLGVLGEYWTEARQGVKARELVVAEEWIKGNFRPDSLVAMSDVGLGGAWVYSPIVSLPELNLLTDNELQDFIDKYRPNLVLVEEKGPGRHVWQAAGYVQRGVEGLKSMAILEKLSP
jgi:hypothetical protein